MKIDPATVKKTTLKKTRIEAAQAGENYYYTGKKCRAGHFGIRRTGTGACRPCELITQKSARDKYQKMLKDNK